MSQGRLSVREALAGRRILVTGGSGFLGKVWLAHLLCELPELEQVVVSALTRDGWDAGDEAAASQAMAPARVTAEESAAHAAVERRPPLAFDLRGIDTNLPSRIRVRSEEDRESLRDAFSRFGHPPDAVARAIVKAIRRRKLRVVVGWEARLTERLKRWFPVGTNRLMARRMDPSGVPKVPR